jgi:hypothetical protein
VDRETYVALGRLGSNLNQLARRMNERKGNPECAAVLEVLRKSEFLTESQTETQNDPETAFSFVDRMAISEGRSSATAARNWSYQEKWRVAPCLFQHLRAGEAVVSLFDGDQNLPPWRMYDKSLDAGLNASWFDRHPE